MSVLNKSELRTLTDGCPSEMDVILHILYQRRFRNELTELKAAGVVDAVHTCTKQPSVSATAQTLLSWWRATDVLRRVVRGEEQDTASVASAAEFALNVRSISTNPDVKLESPWQQHWITFVLTNAENNSDLPVVAEYLLHNWERAASAEKELQITDSCETPDKVDAEYEAELQRELAKATPAIEEEVVRGRAQ